MGNPSEKVVKLLPLVIDRKGSLNKDCEVCFRAEHPRDKFPLNENKALRIFEKVHCDLWGSYRHPTSCGARYFLTIVDDFSRTVWIYMLVDKTEMFLEVEKAPLSDIPIDIEVHEDMGVEEGLGVDDAQPTATMCEHPTQQQQAVGTHGKAVKPHINSHQISADSRGRGGYCDTADQ
ncbi:hypothetical protein AgCh_014815 [Apium graveolens]